MKISDDGQLTILGTQAQDAGKYRCVASNNAGSTSATTQLTIGCMYPLFLSVTFCNNASSQMKNSKG